jgi:hypothetical protein
VNVISTSPSPTHTHQVTHPVFEWFIIFIILANCIFLAIENPYMSDTTADIIKIGDYLFTAIFTAEFILKVIALGFYKGKNAYLSDGMWCV